VKTLIIARHAKSSWDDPAMSDFDRPLNARGLRDLPRMAAALKARDLTPDLILSSPARRARTTAEHYHEVLGGTLQLDERIYEASLMSLIYLAQEAFEQYNTVMIVGHNPGLTMLIDRLSNKAIGNLPTAGAVGIVFEDGSLTQRGRELFYLYPKGLGD